MRVRSWLLALKKTPHRVRAALLYVLDGIAGIATREGFGGVAIVRVDFIGDFILWLDSVDALLERFRGSSITLIANSAWSELAEKLPFWQDVIPVDTVKFVKNPAYRLSILRKISRRGFPIPVQPMNS